MFDCGVSVVLIKNDDGDDDDDDDLVQMLLRPLYCVCKFFQLHTTRHGHEQRHK